jgi:tripartite-type tricarboxylate transporter receptor subunit TctC
MPAFFRMCTAFSAVLMSVGLAAQDYPIRPIRIVVAQAPASGPDLTARAMAQKLTESWGQPVVVENRAGANGIIGGDLVAKSRPDGYTMLLGVGSAIVINPFVYKNLPYDPLRDLAPVTQIFANTFVLIVTPTLPVASVKALVTLAKARPHQLSYGSAGLGNTTHLGAELFAAASGVELLHVPYKGTTPAQTDLMSGHISLMFVTTQGVAPHIASGVARHDANLRPEKQAAVCYIRSRAKHVFSTNAKGNVYVYAYSGTQSHGISPQGRRQGAGAAARYPQRSHRVHCRLPIR